MKCFKNVFYNLPKTMISGYTCGLDNVLRCSINKFIITTLMQVW